MNVEQLRQAAKAAQERGHQLEGLADLYSGADALNELAQRILADAHNLVATADEAGARMRRAGDREQVLLGLMMAAQTSVPQAEKAATGGNGPTTTSDKGQHYCQKCQAPLGQGAKFCSQCGTPASVQDERPPTPPTPPDHLEGGAEMDTVPAAPLTNQPLANQAGQALGYMLATLLMQALPGVNQALGGLPTGNQVLQITVVPRSSTK
jgi:hypothetical protein